MDHSYTSLLGHCRDVEPSSGLHLRIAARIREKIRRAELVRRFVFGSLATASIIAMIPAVQLLAQDFYASNFYRYFSLLFSDGGAVLNAWQEFTMTLAESLPVLSIAVVLSIIFLFIGSINLLTRKERITFLPI